jgi:CheY-specific phosphatase CheX
MRAQVDEQCVIQASSQFWEQMLAMTLVPLPAPAEFSATAGHEGLAYQATSAMMMQPLDTVVQADALDATKEIANIIAGVIKSSLPRPCTMTVPESAVETEGFHTEVQTEDTLEVAFHHDSGDLMVRVLEQECE